MTEDARQDAVRQVLADNGATAPETDLDTLASRIVAVIDTLNPSSVPEGETPVGPDDAGQTVTP